VQITALPKLWLLEVQKPKQPVEPVLQLVGSDEKVLISKRDIEKGTWILSSLDMCFF
jgi:hypothetical protein